MPGASQLSEGMTFVGSRMVRSDDGALQTRLDTKGPDGQDYQIVLDGDASAVIKDIHPGDKVGSFVDKNANIGLVNEKNGAVSFHDKSGHYHSIITTISPTTNPARGRIRWSSTTSIIFVCRPARTPRPSSTASTKATR